MKRWPQIVLWVGMGLLTWGLLHGGFRFVWSRAASLCLSCMGLE